jgi:hypothetical protein
MPIRELKLWYFFGYQMYTTGQIDRALLIFSFAALGGMREAAKTVAHIWKNSLFPKEKCVKLIILAFLG